MIGIQRQEPWARPLAAGKRRLYLCYALHRLRKDADAMACPSVSDDAHANRSVLYTDDMPRPLRSTEINFLQPSLPSEITSS